MGLVVIPCANLGLNTPISIIKTSLLGTLIIIYLFYIALNPCTVLSASQLKGVTLHH